MPLFLGIRLVYADGIDPECPGPVRQPNLAEGITQVGRDESDAAIAIDPMVSDWRTPDIRDGLERRNLVKWAVRMVQARGAVSALAG